MEPRWVSLETVARSRSISLADAAAIVEREHWPKVFKLRETLVLVPAQAVLG